MFRAYQESDYVNPNTSSEGSFEKLQEWITDCQTLHRECPALKPVPLPTRVLDVDPADDGVDCRLVKTAGKIGIYLTLSHCWGTTRMITTTLSTFASREAAIVWNELSQTFKDAISITRKLGFRYLWIDSLCIIQDDSSDWVIESSRVCDIYEKSFLTISAAHGRDGHAG